MSEILLGKHGIASMDVACTWGDGPDVSVIIRFDPKILNQYVQDENRSFLPLDLTSDESLELGLRFTQAGSQAKRLLESYRRDCGVRDNV